MDELKYRTRNHDQRKESTWACFFTREQRPRCRSGHRRLTNLNATEVDRMVHALMLRRE